MGTRAISYEEFIDRSFPVDYQRHLPRAFRTAYADVDDTLATVPFLRAPSGRQLRGYLINAAVDLQLTHLMESGRLPRGRSRKVQFEPNDSNTAKHLEIVFDDCIVTVSQVSSPRAFPRDADFRNNLRLSNQPGLPFAELEADAVPDDKPHLVITHGYKQLDFICIGVPHDKHRTWHFQKRILVAKVDGGNASPFDSARPIEDQAVVKLKPTVERALKKRRDDAG